MANTKLLTAPSISSQQQQTPHIVPPSHEPFNHGKVWMSFEKVGVPVNRLINKVGSEAFWPTGLEDESAKAARILSSFCSMYTLLPLLGLSALTIISEEGVRQENTNAEPSQSQPLPKTSDEKHELSLDTNILNDSTPLIRTSSGESAPPLPPRGPRKTSPALLKIPAEVINNAIGLAIFTTVRAGTWGASLAAGSGVLVARDPISREWSSPSAIGVSTVGLGVLAGIDVADCVIVINSWEALEKFKSLRVSLGVEVGLTAGPWGAGRGADYALGRYEKREDIISAGGKGTYTYVKSRGLYAGLQLDGTVVGVRADENRKFYGEHVSIDDVLGGRARRYTPLLSVLEEIDGLQSKSTKAGLRSPKKQETKLTYAPVLLEFVDRRGQTKGTDGVWHSVADVEKIGEIEKEPSSVIIKEKENLDYSKADRYA